MNPHSASRIRPRQLPELRLWLIHQWQEGELFWEVAQQTRRDRRLPGQEWITLEASFDSRALPDAELYWVTPEMCALIQVAAESLPATTLTPELVPSASGLVFFETPITGTTSIDLTGAEWPELQTIEVRAVLWGESMIPPGPHPAVGLMAYAQHEGFFAPAGRTDWEWGEDTDEPIDESISDRPRMIDSMAEDRRWMATFWLLLSQTGIAETTTIRPQPKDIRRGKRQVPGQTTQHFDVRIVDVHAPKREHKEPSGEGRQVNWSHRWIVNPFWRQQAYGPNHSLRRPMLIGPYIKGPAGLPLKIKDTVHVLKDGEL